MLKNTNDDKRQEKEEKTKRTVRGKSLRRAEVEIVTETEAEERNKGEDKQKDMKGKKDEGIEYE